MHRPAAGLLEAPLLAITRCASACVAAVQLRHKAATLLKYLDLLLLRVMDQSAYVRKVGFGLPQM